jgi:hypothetical protein
VFVLHEKVFEITVHVPPNHVFGVPLKANGIELLNLYGSQLLPTVWIRNRRRVTPFLLLRWVLFTFDVEK